MLEIAKLSGLGVEKIASMLQGTVAPVQSKQIASLGDAERERAIDACVQEASNTVVDIRGQRHFAKLFFMPVIFPPREIQSELTTKFSGASVLNKAIARAGLADNNQGVRLISKLFSHGEVSSWSTGKLNKVLRLIVGDAEMQKANTANAQPSSSANDLPILTYLVGAVYTPYPAMPSLSMSDWSKASAIARNTLGLQDSTAQEMVMPLVLKPMEYKDALIEGTAGAVQMMASVISESVSAVDEDDADVLSATVHTSSVDMDVNFTSAGDAVLEMNGDAVSVQFQLDRERLGRTGVDRVIQSAFAAVGSFGNGLTAN